MSASIPYRNISGNATAQLAAKGTTMLKHAVGYNKTTADVWLQIYDATSASDVTVGSTTPKKSILLPFSDGTKYSAGEYAPKSPLKLDLGLVWAVTVEPDAAATTPTSNCFITFDIE